MNILVTGATGHLGKAVTESLLTKTDASNITVLVRDETKAIAFKDHGIKIAVGSYDDYASLVKAFTGIDKVYLVSSNDIPNRAKQQENVVNAAKEAGVKHIVYTSFQRKNETETSPIIFISSSHLYTEQIIKRSGLTYTLLLHGLYADIIPQFAGGQLLQTKTIYLPADEGKTAYAARIDFAEAGANVLLDETGKYDNQSIELTGSEALSWQQIANIISGITGQTIQYVSPSVDEFTAALTQAHVPAEIIGLIAGFAKGMEDGEFDNVTSDMENLLGRKPVTVADYLKSVYGKQ